MGAGSGGRSEKEIYRGQKERGGGGQVIPLGLVVATLTRPPFAALGLSRSHVSLDCASLEIRIRLLTLT